ncbi:protealysin inhibitor emfourin [Enemella evansiae]|uniref:protealysin inhibitor emfourin n=1 Tax=Enemella evansiae TaxID=2016499 RepID=UPI000B977D19|nr:protealysin inhibitor emfourin [Enemella evansiae]OYO15152.1 metalloprotease [Enemella evansiae]TDO92696.1 thermolysin metallopeptidase-like protein [Enemella evansiae]
MTANRVHTLLPPYLLENLAQRADGPTAERARATLAIDAGFRGARARAGARPTATTRRSATTPKGPERTISDAQNTETLPGETVRTEGAPATGDAAVDEAYDGFGVTWRLYAEAYARDSLDGNGLPLLGTVHYGQDYDNAFWDGTQMVFGDGDGELFNRFTVSLDVIGHELTHGVIEHTANLTYQGQSGALNESIADVFGIQVKQFLAGQTAEQSDWLIGAGLFTAKVKGRALRSMREPGTAYDDPTLGKDPQVGDFADYVETTEDNGGVHINSGIPNRAFCLTALALGGRSWEAAGQVWYAVLTGGKVPTDCDFATFAALTIAEAEARDVRTAAAVTDAWQQVGVTPAATPAPAPGTPKRPTPSPTVDPRTRIEVSRSGGITGRQQRREVRLDDLPGSDGERWQQLLAGDQLQQLADRPATGADRFVYGLRCPDADVDLSIPEPDLPDQVQQLFRRTLEG